MTNTEASRSPSVEKWPLGGGRSGSAGLGNGGDSIEDVEEKRLAGPPAGEMKAESTHGAANPRADLEQAKTNRADRGRGERRGENEGATGPGGPESR